MIAFKELAIKLEEKGYSGDLLDAKLSQDIILLLLSKSHFSHNITIKGGVVICNLSNDIRRATLDLDFDLIRFPLNNEGIKRLIKDMDGVEGVSIKIIGEMEPLKHQDYQGKRINVSLTDSFGNALVSKIDIGVHKYLSLEQIDYCFDISTLDDGVSLLINSQEQMFAEKLKSLLRFGVLSTRYKDIYDLYFLIDHVDKKKLLSAFEVSIFNDEKIKENSIREIVERLNAIFSNITFINKLSTSHKNWTNDDDEIVLKKIIQFISEIN